LTAQADSLGVGVRAVPGDEVSVPDAVAGGVAMADAEVDGGADLVVVAAPDASAVPALVVSVLTGAEPVALLPRGAAATDTAAWIARAEYLRDTRRGVAALRHEPGRLLIATGDVVLAMVTGFVLRAVARRTPLLLDGAAAAAAALIAYRVQPRAGRWWRFADRSADPVHVRVTRDLEQVPILDLGTTAGDGTVGLLAVPLVRAAVPSADGASDA
jgi:nicotinate-nucleotide--dimethylbenzimidazole phosphoribosyltransferase